jgi:hypothetical protein
VDAKECEIKVKFSSAIFVYECKTYRQEEADMTAKEDDQSKSIGKTHWREYFGTLVPASSLLI